MAQMIVSCIIARQWKKEGRDNTTLTVFDLETARELSISWPGEIEQAAIDSRAPVQLHMTGVEIRRTKEGSVYIVAASITGNAAGKQGRS